MPLLEVEIPRGSADADIDINSPGLVLPGARCPAGSGLYAPLDGAAPIWTVPQPSTVNRRS
jgi:hypothetical protein